MLIKVCGMRDPANIAQVDDAGCDMIGFIFYDRSKRYAGTMPINMPVRSRKVGVFVNSPAEHIISIASAWGLDYVQLHGQESPEMCDTLRAQGLRVIKAISIDDRSSLAEADRFEGRADILLFDTKCSGFGGSGRAFDWEILRQYHGSTPFMLSGGLGPDNIMEIKEFRHPQCIGIDLNSKFELRPGLKDVSSVKNFIKQIRQ